MAFSPNRELLNVNFEGYKLSESLLSHVSKELTEEVRVAKLKDEDYSYQHMRAFSLHNHLAVDPYDDARVYWYTSDGKIQQGTYSAGDISVRTCYSIPPPSGPATNPTFAFVNGTHCLFSNGGPQLFVFYTNPSSSSSSGDPPQEWQLELTVPASSDNDGNTPIMIIVATISKSKNSVDVLFAELCDPSSIQHVRSSTSTDSSVAIFKWLRFSLSNEGQQQQQQDADSAETTVISFKDAKVSTVASFECRAFPLYAAIVEKNILFISEAKPPLKEDADIGMEEVEKDNGDGEGVVGGAKAGNQEGEEHHGLGYDDLGYQWSQTESDITVTLTLPGNIKKADLECEIESNEVVLGLTDGTTYLRGKLHAPIDPEASTWTFEKNVLEVTLEKKEPGKEWPYLHTDSKPKKHVYLSEREDGLMQEELDKAEILLQEMKKKSADKDASPSETPPPAKRPRPLVQMPQEDCDTSVEDTTLFMISDRSTIFGRLGLGGRQIVFTSPGANDLYPYVSIRHDVDAVVWQPIGGTAWSHVTTFNALGYIQASKEDRKFTVAPPSLKFVAVSDCKRHVFVYVQPPEGIKGNSSAEGVHTMSSMTDILGLRASDKGLVFALTSKTLTVLTVSLS